MWRDAASAQQQPDRGEHEHLVRHLDVEELVHHLDVEELLHHLDEQLPHDATNLDDSSYSLRQEPRRDEPELPRLDEQLRHDEHPLFEF